MGTMECQGGYSTAIIESIAADGGNAFAEGHGGQTAAPKESSVAYGGDVVGYNQVFHFLAVQI